jgi:hypothetical protein
MPSSIADRRTSSQPPLDRGMRGRSRTFIIHLTLFLSSTSISLFVAEMAARVMAPRAISYPWMDFADGITVPLPNVRGRHFVPGSYDTSFSFNAQRFRGPDLYNPEPDAGTTRIAILGSSFAFGSGANDNESYPFQLESILNAQALQSGLETRYQVINAGIPGTVVAEQAIWYHRWVKQFHPQLVVLSLSCVIDFPTGLFASDDLGNVAPREPRQQHPSASLHRFIRHVPGYVFLSEHSELFNLLMLKIGETVREARTSATGEAVSQASPGGRTGGLKAALSMEASELLWLNQDAKQAGARLAVVVLPCHENIGSAASAEAEEIRREYTQVVSTSREVAIRGGTPVLDLAPVLRSLTAQSQRDLYYNGWFETHPTPTGYRAIARAVAQFLQDSNLVHR